MVFLMAENKKDLGKLSAEQDQIEVNLKKVYSDVLSEPLPDKLTDLLNQLKSGKKPDDR